jgi:hypothetical protein
VAAFPIPEGSIIVVPGGPDNTLPGQPPYPSQGPGFPTNPIAPGGSGGPVDPGYGYPLPPVRPDNSPPRPPVYPSHQPVPPGYVSGQPVPPTYPVDPAYGLPITPGIWPSPPVFPGHDLPIAPVLPTHPIYRPVAPNNDLPLPPGAVWPPLPPSVTGPVLCFVWLVGIGYRWTTVDPSLKPSHPIVIPPSTVPGAPNQDLPLQPQPKR